MDTPLMVAMAFPLCISAVGLWAIARVLIIDDWLESKTRVIRTWAKPSRHPFGQEVHYR